MTRLRIFLGSSGQQQRLLKSLENGLSGVADVVPWTVSFDAGSMTLTRLVELTRRVDFAAFIFAQDDWTGRLTDDGSGGPGQASPRDNVVFEAGLFGGVLGMERTFILHANGAKLPTDLQGLTCVRYSDDLTAQELKTINQKVRSAIENQWGQPRVEGDWWQYSQTARSEDEPSAVSLLRISRDQTGALQVSGRSWQEDGTLSARYASDASRETRDPASLFYFWTGTRPRHPDAPRLEGTGEIAVESPGLARGYFTTRSESDPGLHVKTVGVYVRADPGDWSVLDAGTGGQRADLIKERLEDWTARANS